MLISDADFRWAGGRVGKREGGQVGGRAGV